MTKSTASDRCSFRDAAGRRCRLPRKPSNPSFCAHHACFSADGILDDPLAIVAEVLGDSPDFSDARVVNRIAGKLLTLFLAGRIAARHAAVAGYLFQMVVQTLPQIERQENLSRPGHPNFRAPFTFITHIPRPEYPQYPQDDSPSTTAPEGIDP